MEFSSFLDLPVSDMQMKMVGHVPNNSGPQYLSISNEQMGIVGPVSSGPASENLMAPITQGGNDQVSGGTSSMVLNPILMSNQLGAENANMLRREKPSVPIKRKVEVGPMLHNNTIPQPSPLHSKRLAHTPVRSELASPGSQAQSLLNKKTIRNDSMTKSSAQQGQNTKKQTIRTVPASKGRSESSEAIRSKMRESLAAALELAYQNPDSVSNTEKDKTGAVTDPMTVTSQASDSKVTAGDVDSASQVLSSKAPAVDKSNDVNDLLSNESSVNGGKIFEEFQFGSFLPDEDVAFTDNFFAKDDLLQGNGLSWAFEFDTQMREAKQAQDAETLQPVKLEDYAHQPVKQEDSKEVIKLTPSDLANKIETELFKLYGSANKKYKEKGRSLLFNLKDRSNPELRERVMSGEISPEKLCSMSAEELASKELSEWRMAKAEEMAQMVVLPDTEGDVRRLVKKTHKGEYQVEFERDDVMISEVSGGISVSMQLPLPKREDNDIHSPLTESTGVKNMVAGQDNGSGNQDTSSSLVIPTDGTDFMQGIMVDEIKDPALLPPIVSLDEFMESLNAEPPFENISEAEEAKNPLMPKEIPKAIGSPKQSILKKPDTNKREAGLVKKLIRTSPKQKVTASPPLKVDYIWQGKLLLNIASAVTVGGVFQSGEKTSTKEWSTSVEVKGKVKIDPFEKFLQDLPMSRTRAVMVLLIVLKDKTFDDDRANLSEAVNSYIEDQRLGYAEPAPGVELYLCPPTLKMIEMLNKHMPKHALPNTNSYENELIGVVVWRRVSNTISPNSTSHHKNTAKKQSFATPKRVQDSPNINANIPNRTPPGFSNVSQPNPENQPDEDDDIPPGFGPVAAARANKDDDDLPEFNFSGHLNRPVSQISPLSVTHGIKMPQRPVDQVRELIKKYGQSDTSAPSMSRSNNGNLSIQPWDDDDDIPEWKPEAPIQLHHPTLNAQRPPAQLFSKDRHIAPVVTHPTHLPPGGSGQPQPGGRWPRPPGPLHGARWRPY